LPSLNASSPRRRYHVDRHHSARHQTAAAAGISTGEARGGHASQRPKQFPNKRSIERCASSAAGHSGDMHVADPSREPMLERAMPADAVPGTTIPERSEAIALTSAYSAG
jgi:hypothetical protein